MLRSVSAVVGGALLMEAGSRVRFGQAAIAGETHGPLLAWQPMAAATFGRAARRRWLGPDDGEGCIAVTQHGTDEVYRYRAGGEEGM